MPKLLDNNYFTRIDAMIVLGMAGGTTNTALWISTPRSSRFPIRSSGSRCGPPKGYTYAAQSGRVNVDTLRALIGAAALVEFLNSDPEDALLGAVPCAGGSWVAAGREHRIAPI